MPRNFSAFTFVIFSVLTLTSVQAHEGATGVVKARMDAFMEARAQMKQIGGALRQSDFETVAEIAAQMHIWADKMATHFPEGSDKAPSEAAPAIWTDKAGFAAHITAYQHSLTHLGEAALSADRDIVAQAFGAVGQACKNCHKSYRK